MNAECTRVLLLVFHSSRIVSCKSSQRCFYKCSKVLSLFLSSLLQIGVQPTLWEVQSAVNGSHMWPHCKILKVCQERELVFPKTLWRDPSLSISWEASLTVPLPSAGVVVFTHIMYHPNNSGLFEGVISFARFCPLLIWIRRASICAMERVAPTCNGGTTTSGAMQY